MNDVIPTYIGPDEPQSPFEGQVWLNTNTQILYYYSSPVWLTFSFDVEHIELSSEESPEEAYERAMKIL